MRQLMLLPLLVVLLTAITQGQSSTGTLARIEYQQALDKYMEGKGIALSNEHVVMGIPLQDAWNITAVNQLGMTGVARYQFWLPSNQPKYPSGNLRWVFAAFPVTLSANEKRNDIYLTTGAGAPAGANLATDLGATISVATGTATFVVKKANFNFIDSALVGPTTIVASGHSGGVYANDGTTVFSSVKDGTGTATIEVNGPEYAVVRAQGILKDGSSNEYFQYVVRLLFYRDKQYVRSQVHIFNSQQTPNASRAVKNVEVRLPITTLVAPLNFNLAKGEGSTGQRSLGTNAYLYGAYSRRNQGFQDGITIGSQAVGDFTLGSGWAVGYIPVDPAVQSGFFAFNDATELTTATDHDSEADWTRGWARLSDGTGKGAIVGYRGFHAFFPTAIELDSASKQFRIGLLSDRTTRTALVWDYMTAESREIVWDFEAAAGKAETDVWQITNYPPVGRSLNLQDYAETLDVGFVPYLATATEIKNQLYAPIVEAGNNSYATVYPSSPAYNLVNDQQRIWRRIINDEGGALNNMEYTLKWVTPWLQSGFPGFYLDTYWQANFVADQVVTSSLGWTYTNNAWNNKTTPGREFNGGRTHFQSGAPFHHIWAYGLPIAYYLTTDEHLPEMLKDHLEFIQTRTSGSYLGTWGINLAGGNRIDRESAHEFANLAMGYYFAGINATEFLAAVDKLVTMRTAAEPNATAGSRQDDGWYAPRGLFWYGDRTGLTEHLNRSLQWHNIAAMSILYGYQALNRTADRTRQEQLRGLILSSAYMYLDEQLWYLRDPASATDPDKWAKALSYYRTEISQNPCCAGTSYGNPVTGCPLLGCGNFGTWQAGHELTTAYLLTGDPQFLSQAKINMLYLPKFQGIAYISPNNYALWQPEFAWAVYVMQHTNQLTAGSLNLNVQAVSGGAYNLSWSAPAIARSAWIKYADKPLQMSLRFDQATRKYQFDPSLYTPFGVGGQPGEAQTLRQSVTLSSGQLTTPVLGSGKQWKAVWFSFNPNNFRSTDSTNSTITPPPPDLLSTPTNLRVE